MMKKYIVMLVGLCNVVYAAENGKQLSRSCPDFVTVCNNQHWYNYFKNHRERLGGSFLSNVKVSEKYYDEKVVVAYRPAITYRAVAKKKGLSVSQ
jgi:hypothetical protein